MQVSAQKVSHGDVLVAGGQAGDQDQSDEVRQNNNEGEAKANVVDVLGCQSQKFRDPVRCRGRIQNGVG